MDKNLRTIILVVSTISILVSGYLLVLSEMTEILNNSFRNKNVLIFYLIIEALIILFTFFNFAYRSILAILFILSVIRGGLITKHLIPVLFVARMAGVHQNIFDYLSPILLGIVSIANLVFLFQIYSNNSIKK